MKVLLAEDSLTLLLTTTKAIEKAGHQVIQAKNGIEALERYDSEKPDLVILDVMMPKKDGYEVASQIRARYASEWVPIIFLTGMVRDEDITKGIDAGGDDYLTKPVSNTVLASKLKAMERIADMRKKLIEVTHDLEMANKKLRQLSYLDGLTGIYNRLYFDEFLPKEWYRCRRNNAPLSVLLIDIDHFKQYNDTYGHLAGDICLKKVAREMDQQLARSGDVICRYGGEEFIMILPDTDNDGAINVAERICQSITALKIPCSYGNKLDFVSISIGCASMIPNPEINLTRLIDEADKALYRAKETGRNCVRSAQLRETEVA